jgi:hypothetical protein
MGGLNLWVWLGEVIRGHGYMATPGGPQARVVVHLGCPFPWDRTSPMVLPHGQLGPWRPIARVDRIGRRLEYGPGIGALGFEGFVHRG